MRVLDATFAAAFGLLCKVLLQDEWRVLQSQMHVVLEKKLYVLDDSSQDVFFRALVAAEDRRFFQHFGVDVRAIVRAIWALLTRRSVQGASTITQQLVRVLIGRYELTVNRKVREILLACQMDRHFSKSDQLAAYLGVAYFGWRMNGLQQAIRRLNLVQPITDRDGAQVVSRLKYPEPQFPSRALQEKIERRSAYVMKIMERA